MLVRSWWVNLYRCRWQVIITPASLVIRGTVRAGALAASFHLPACICQVMDGPDDRRKRLKAMRAEADASGAATEEGLNGDSQSCWTARGLYG